MCVCNVFVCVYVMCSYVCALCEVCVCVCNVFVCVCTVCSMCNVCVCM